MHTIYSLFFKICLFQHSVNNDIVHITIIQIHGIVWSATPIITKWKRPAYERAILWWPTMVLPAHAQDGKTKNKQKNQSMFLLVMMMNAMEQYKFSFTRTNGHSLDTRHLHTPHSGNEQFWCQNKSLCTSHHHHS